MKHVMVRYTVQANRADENARLIGEVFEALRRTAPKGISYASYRMDDGVSFVHVASVQDPDNNPLKQLAEFNKFTSGIKERCEVTPVTVTLNEVGSYINA